MKILLTGATGYIGKRLLPNLISQGHHVVCCVRDKNRFTPPSSTLEHIEIIEVDFLDNTTLSNIPKDIEGAFYLIHSMSASNDYQQMERTSAIHFRKWLSETSVRHVVYLSGIINDASLSKHLSSRKAVEEELKLGSYALTTLRSGIIIGSGSASFEIIRDLVEKLPVMIAPKWLNTRCQPIGVRDVLNFLLKSLFNENTYNEDFDIGGPKILTYKEMLLGFAEIRGLQRIIMTVPVMTPKLSSYWLYFVTRTSYRLASTLVSSMKVEVVCRNNKLNKILDVEPESYIQALDRSFAKIVNHDVVSSWKDSWVSGDLEYKISDQLNVPEFGCFRDQRIKKSQNAQRSVQRIWSIGGENGWYAFDALWKVRGFIDKLYGGVGLRRGRTNPSSISSGDAIDFWRVIYADRKEARLLLYAEMKLPGEAWLEFKVKNNYVTQTATFRPKGIWGRLYWYAVVPFHGLVFKGMLNRISAA